MAMNQYIIIRFSLDMKNGHYQFQTGFSCISCITYEVAGVIFFYSQGRKNVMIQNFCQGLDQAFNQFC